MLALFAAFASPMRLVATLAVAGAILLTACAAIPELRPMEVQYDNTDIPDCVLTEDLRNAVKAAYLRKEQAESKGDQ